MRMITLGTANPVTYVIGDFEFTGSYRVGDQLVNCPIRGDILSGALIALDSDFNLLAELEFRSAPISRLWFSGTEVHKITLGEAMRFPPASKAVDRVLDFLSKCKGPITFVNHALGHAIPIRKLNGNGLTGEYAIGNVDYWYLHWMCMKQNRQYELYKYLDPSRLISTVTMARSLSKVTGLSSARLNVLCEYFKIPLNHHNALSDARATAKVFRELVKLSNSSDLFGITKEEAPQREALTLF